MPTQTPPGYDDASGQPTQRNPVEKRRMPDGPGASGEQPGKRTNDERNDPEAEPGARDGKPPR